MNIVFRTLSRGGSHGDNQDCVLEPIKSGADLWCAIADGMGGSCHGAIASRLCIEALKQNIADGKTMDDLFKIVFNYMKYWSRLMAIGQDIGSTLSLMRLSRGRAFVGHVGDTRITHYRGDGVMDRTHDQTEVQKLLDDGVLSKYQARRYPRRNVILSVMSPNRRYTLFQNEFSVQGGDRILLTSDGFHQKIRKRSISEISKRFSKFDLFVRSVEYEVASIDVDDDATCLAIEIKSVT